MYRRPRWPFVTGGVAAALVLAAVVTYFVTRGEGPHKNGNNAYSTAKQTIPVAGARLAAEVLTPKKGGSAPLLVMPGSWGADANFYGAVAARFAQAGYQVVEYAQRGFGASTGQIDFAGPATQHDARQVISWALQHTHADARRVAMLGTSYGAGVSLMTAAHDPRVRVVVALSTWANLADSYDQDGTPNVYGLAALLGKDRPQFDGTVRQLRQTLLNAPATLGAQLHAMSPTRSPDALVRELNKNKPAILIANGFEDSLLNPRQLIPFFTALNTPKRLELAAGDHGGPELSAFAGHANQTLDDAKAWLDHYLLGTVNGIETEDPIVLRDVRGGQLHTYRSWPTPSKKDQVPLSAPGAKIQSGDTTKTAWSATIAHAGTDSGASSGTMQFGSTSYALPRVAVAALKESDAFVWNGPSLSTSVVLAGTPAVRLGLSSTSRTATIYLHLYDVDSSGRGSLVEFQPYTATNLSRTKATYLTIQMQPISWDVPAGDHLTLVIDTYDKRYQSLTPAGNSVTVSATKSQPAAFIVPFST